MNTAPRDFTTDLPPSLLIGGALGLVACLAMVLLSLADSALGAASTFGILAFIVATIVIGAMPGVSRMTIDNEKVLIRNWPLRVLVRWADVTEIEVRQYRGGSTYALVFHKRQGRSTTVGMGRWLSRHEPQWPDALIAQAAQNDVAIRQDSLLRLRRVFHNPQRLRG